MVPATVPSARASLPSDPDERALVELGRARDLFVTFIEKAGTDPQYAETVARARDRVEDLNATMAFIKAGRR